MHFKKQKFTIREKVRLLKIAKRVNKKLYLRLKHVNDENFIEIAQHGIIVSLKHKYIYLENYIERLRKIGLDVFSPSVELLKAPYRIGLVKVNYSAKDAEEALHIFANVERELKNLVNEHDQIISQYRK